MYFQDYNLIKINREFHVLPVDSIISLFVFLVASKAYFLKKDAALHPENGSLRRYLIMCKDDIG